MKRPSDRTLTWLFISRLVGLVIVMSLLIFFLVESVLGKDVDRTLTLAFLSIATGLLGIPPVVWLARHKL